MKNVRSKVTYHPEGDYLIPDLVASNDKNSNYQIGKYGYLRLEYLKKNKRGYYTELMLDGTLPEHLSDIDKRAIAKVKDIINKLAKSHNVDEKFKQNNQLEWVRLMNNFKNAVEEVVLKELIYI